MAEVTRKRTGKFVRRLFEILIANSQGVPAKQALKQVQDSFDLTEYEAGYYDSGAQRFEKIVRFATVDCVKAGWMQKNKGIWTVTDEGIDAFNKYVEPEQFYGKAGELYRQWKKAQDTHDPDPEKEESEKEVRITFETAEEAAWSEVKEYLGSMNPYEFQELVADLLRAMGFYSSWVAPPGKDGGTDIVAYPDPLGTTSPRVKV